MIKALAINGPPPLHWKREAYAKWASYSDEMRWTAYDIVHKIRCPVCGAVVWPGVRHRIDARYCSPACRTAAWRARQASR